MLFFLEHFDQAVAFSHQALMVGKAALWNLCDESTSLYHQALMIGKAALENAKIANSVGNALESLYHLAMKCDMAALISVAVLVLVLLATMTSMQKKSHPHEIKPNAHETHPIFLMLVLLQQHHRQLRCMFLLMLLC
jgi:hypothetical protein